MKLTLLALSLTLITPTFARTAARTVVKSDSPIVALAYAPDGKILASADASHRVRLTEVSSGQVKQIFGYKSAVAALAYAPDGKLLAIGVGREVRLLDPNTDMKTAAPTRVLKAQGPVADTLQFSKDGRVLLAVEASYSGDTSDAVDVWDVVSGRRMQRYQPKYFESYGAALSPDGRQFVASTHIADLALFSVKTGQKIRDLSVKIPHSTGFYTNSLAFSPNGKWIIGAGGFMESSGNVAVWEAQSGQVKWSHVIADYGVAIAWSPDGLRVAVGTSYDTTYDDPKDLHRPTGAPIWSANGKWQRSLHRVPGRINMLAWSPDGVILALGDDKGRVVLGDMR